MLGETWPIPAALRLGMAESRGSNCPSGPATVCSSRCPREGRSQSPDTSVISQHIGNRNSVLVQSTAMDHLHSSI